jgi:hypothetical protein
MRSTRICNIARPLIRPEPCALATTPWNAVPSGMTIRPPAATGNADSRYTPSPSLALRVETALRKVRRMWVPAGISTRALAASTVSSFGWVWASTDTPAANIAAISNSLRMLPSLASDTRITVPANQTNGVPVRTLPEVSHQTKIPHQLSRMWANEAACFSDQRYAIPALAM